MSRILHICTNDVAGGAARAAYRQHQGLISIGIDSRMVVADKGSYDESVSVQKLSSKPFARVRRVLRRQILRREAAVLSRHRREASEIFSHPYSVYLGGWENEFRDASLVNLHWVSGFIDYRSFFGNFPFGKPLVWTLHDLNPMTAGCHYTSGCLKFTGHCYCCPQLGSEVEKDRAFTYFELKSRSLQGLDPQSTVVVASSNWLKRQIRISTLLGRFRIEHIPIGLDVEVYRPRDRHAARKSFGIQSDEHLILFVGELANHRKGFDLLLSAIRILQHKTKAVLAMVGVGNVPKISDVRSLNVGRVDSDLLLSVLYSAADVLVIPSREETFGQVASEAMACGCPVVGFSIGGIPDIVDNGQTGFLAAPFDIRQLRDGIEAALARRDDLADACRARAERLFSVKVQAQAYASLYRDIFDHSKIRSGRAIYDRILDT